VFLELVELFGGSFEDARKGEERRSDEERHLFGLGVCDVLEHHGDDKVGFDVEAEQFGNLVNLKLKEAYPVSDLLVVVVDDVLVDDLFEDF